MYWRRDQVRWSNRPRILGAQQLGAKIVDFTEQVGLYVLYDGSRPIYVGQVSRPRLGARLFEHTRDHLNERWQSFFFGWQFRCRCSYAACAATAEYLLSTALRFNSREIVDLFLPIMLAIKVIVQFWEQNKYLFSLFRCNMFVMTHSGSWYVDVFANTIVPVLWVIIYLLHLDCKFKYEKMKMG